MVAEFLPLFRNFEASGIKTLLPSIVLKSSLQYFYAVMNPHAHPEQVLSESLADALKSLICDKQMAVASALGVQPSRVSEWLHGKGQPGLHHLAEIVNQSGKGGDADKVHQLTKLLILAEAESIIKNGQGEPNEKWTAQAKQLAKKAVQNVYQETIRNLQKSKLSGRTLSDFPDAFYPLAVVTGDKREESEARISKADFGAVSASPAEARWIFRLGLHKQVEFYSDKVVCLENLDRLKDKFGKKNILVIGSPGSNHLARRLHLAKPPTGWRRGVPIFRFNQLRSTLEKIETVQESLTGLNRGQLRGKQADPKTADDLKFWLHELFQGGILDPTCHNRWKRGMQAPGGATDFGLLSFARNPFSDEADGDHYVCILAAGFHLIGTAQAVQLLSHPEEMKDHPFGGVIHVDIDQDKPFSARLDDSRPRWDTNSNYTIDTVREGIRLLKHEMPPEIELSLTKQELQECSQFIEAL